MKINNTVDQFIKSTLFGVIPATISLLLSFLLDKIMNQKISNFIGIITAYGTDFFIQQKIFVGHNENNNRYRNRYIVAVIIAIILIQSLFILTVDYFKKYHNDFYKNKWGKYVLLVRWIIKAFVYVSFEFPFQKLWVFKTP